MALFTKKTAEDRQLTAARGDLDAAQRKLSTLLAHEDAAAASADRWGQWTAERDAAAAEVARLTALVNKLEAVAEAARIHDETEATRRRLAAARKAADDLAVRIRTDGQRIAAELLQLMREAARQSLEAKALNADLPKGEALIPAADILARDFGAEPRKDVRTRDVELWVAESTGVIIGNQDAVVSADGVHGQVNVGASMRWKCLKRRFRETEYHPPYRPDWPGDLFALVKLPHFAAPGLLFDGGTLLIEQVAALDVDAATKPAKKPKRSVQVELVPIDPAWPPAGTPTEASRNVAA